jgi:hypothetical protein
MFGVEERGLFKTSVVPTRRLRRAPNGTRPCVGCINNNHLTIQVQGSKEIAHKRRARRDFI